MKRAWVVVMVAACGAPAAKSAGSASAEPNHAEPKAATSEDAGASTPRACLRESKDPMPCSEDCDRGIAESCVILAGRVHAIHAVSLYERACELRDAPACVTAARYHASGNGVPPNRAKQMELLAHACLLGDAPSCNTPAKAFANGNGVVRDERRANELWQRGCGGGIEAACNALGDAGL